MSLPLLCSWDRELNLHLAQFRIYIKWSPFFLKFLYHLSEAVTLVTLAPLKVMPNNTDAYSTLTQGGAAGPRALPSLETSPLCNQLVHEDTGVNWDSRPPSMHNVFAIFLHLVCLQDSFLLGDQYNDIHCSLLIRTFVNKRIAMVYTSCHQLKRHLIPK